MPRPKLNKKVAYLQIQVNPEDKAALEAWCLANKITMSQVIRTQIQPYIEKGRSLIE